MAWLFSKRSTEPDGTTLYAAVVAEMRRPDWYVAAAVPDSIDGRFAVLSTLLALADIRLGQGDEAARRQAPRLAERFIADMDVQMREAGFGDPSLGKQVRMMVGSLASRVERWQLAIEGAKGSASAWNEAVVPSLYRDEPPAEDAIDAGAQLARDWWQRLGDAKDSELAEGQIA